MKNKFYYSPELMFMDFDARDVITASDTGSGGSSGSNPDELPDMEPDD